MSSAAQIFKKDFRVYFVSPIAYIVISIFLILSGWFFFSRTISRKRTTSLRSG